MDPHPDTQIFSSPVAVGDLVIVGVASIELAFPQPYTFRGSVVALDAASGDEVWRTYVTDDDDFGAGGLGVVVSRHRQGPRASSTSAPASPTRHRPAP